MACGKWQPHSDPRYADCVRCGFSESSHADRQPPPSPSPAPPNVVQMYRNEFGGLCIVRPSGVS